MLLLSCKHSTNDIGVCGTVPLRKSLCVPSAVWTQPPAWGEGPGPGEDMRGHRPWWDAGTQFIQGRITKWSYLFFNSLCLVLLLAMQLVMFHFFPSYLGYKFTWSQLYHRLCISAPNLYSGYSLKPHVSTWVASWVASSKLYPVCVGYVLWFMAALKRHLLCNAMWMYTAWLMWMSMPTIFLCVLLPAY